MVIPAAASTTPHTVATPRRPLSQRSGHSLKALAAAAVMTVGMAMPTLAADPFRSSEEAVGSKTGQAFELMFKQNDYKAAQALLDQATAQEKEEPLLYTLQALLVYQNEDDQNWGALRDYASKTKSAAKALKRQGDERSKLRGNLYLAMADFLDGAHAITKDGPVRGMSTAFSKLRGIYGSMKKARAIDPEDPELNLVQGFLDMMVSAYLPLSDQKAAIKKLESVRDTNPEAAYLANWALATGYRNVKQNDKALEAVNRGLETQPDHAELRYLKAQIFEAQGNHAGAKPEFAKALEASATMPDNLVAQIFYEACKNEQKLDAQPRGCDPMRDAIRDDDSDPWGPEVLPAL